VNCNTSGGQTVLTVRPSAGYVSYPKAPAGRKGRMRYVLLVVALGLLVVGAYGSYAYTADAAHVEPQIDPRMLFGTERASVAELKTSGIEAEIARGRAVFAAKARQFQQAQQDQEAIASYGKWGPDLVAAAQRYGQDPAVLYRVMICESKGDPLADNGVCKGLFQFNPATWSGTPYGGQSIFDGHAQIMAAAWMFSQGRQGEWTCY